MIENKKMEQEASLFAMLLLMPEQFIKEDVEQGFDLASDDFINRLSKKYQVPKTAVAMRIAYYLQNKQ